MNPLSVVESRQLPVLNAPPNQLLASLPPAEFQRLLPDLSYRALKLRQVLYKQGDRFPEVYFPLGSICSLVTHMDDGAALEVAMVGPEGMVGIGAILGAPVATCDAVVQIPGSGAYAMGLDAFEREMTCGGPFATVVASYTRAFVGMLVQSIACNGLHSAEERCCRWLLMTHDRVGQNEFGVTHELLSMKLGVRRPTVTLVLAQLAKAGMIEQERGRMRIIDRASLEAASCECYGSVKRLFER